MPAPAATVTGYDRTTKALHWATVLVLLAQLVVGYLVDVDDSGRGRGRGRGGDSGRGRGRGGDDDAAAVLDRLVSGDEPLLALHVLLGVTVLVLAATRLRRRRVVPLPPWAETLSSRERTWAHRTEQLLYLSLVVMPLSGIGVLLVDEDLLALHVTTHVVFFAALAAHLGLVLKHQLLDRDRLLRRML